MGELAGWIAPIATTLAACITAANLGARVTGWGFVVFTVGSIAWTTYGIATDQPNLLWQNLLLTGVNLIGIWRWLGRRARFDDGAQAAAQKSGAREVPTLFPVSQLTDGPVGGRDGEPIATAIDAMATYDGKISYLVVGAGGVGGVGETLYALPWDRVRADANRITALLTREQLTKLEAIEPTNWPARVSSSAGDFSVVHDLRSADGAANSRKG